MAWHRPGDKPLSEPMMVKFTDAYMRHSASASFLFMAEQSLIQWEKTLHAYRLGVWLFSLFKPCWYIAQPYYIQNGCNYFDTCMTSYRLICRGLRLNCSYYWMIARIYIHCLIIIIKSEVWTIIHCLGLGHETMVCAVCLSIFLLEIRYRHRLP